MPDSPGPPRGPTSGPSGATAGDGSRDRHAGEVPLVVLESFGPPHATTNPYLVQLFASFPEGVRPEYFSWRRALVGRWDVLHLHWPENLLRGATPLRSTVRGVLFAALMLRVRVTRSALVRTRHNVEPHERPTAAQRRLIALSERLTTLWITLSEAVPTPPGALVSVIPIGDYRDWFDAPNHGDQGAPRPVTGRLLHFGQVRRYKGVEGLLDAFAALEDPALSLHVVGQVRDAELRERLARAATEDPRISVLDSHVDDDTLQREVLEAQLVVLPFTEITNSSSLLLALSLGRPALVPDASTMTAVADEVGRDWVLTFHPPLSATSLRAALAASAPERSPEGSPELSARRWSRIGELHAEAFRAARAAVGTLGSRGA